MAAMLDPRALVRLAGMLSLCSWALQYLELLFSLPSGIILPVVADHLLCAALGLGCGDRDTSYSPEALMSPEDSL